MSFEFVNTTPADGDTETVLGVEYVYKASSGWERSGSYAGTPPYELVRDDIDNATSVKGLVSGEQLASIGGGGPQILKDWSLFSGTSLDFFSGLDTANGYEGWEIEIDNLQTDIGSFTSYSFQGNLIFKVNGGAVPFKEKTSRGYARTATVNQTIYGGAVFLSTYEKIISNGKIKLSSNLTNGVGGLFLKESTLSYTSSDTNSNLMANSFTRISFRSPQVPNELILSFNNSFTCNYRIIKQNY